MPRAMGQPPPNGKKGSFASLYHHQSKMLKTMLNRPLRSR